jgi:hypothetical protein
MAKKTTKTNKDPKNVGSYKGVGNVVESRIGQRKPSK